MRVVIVALLLLTGCQKTGSGEAPQIGTSSDVRLWTDKDTGCQYFYSSNANGSGAFLTPRMAADGTQVCGVHQ